MIDKRPLISWIRSRLSLSILAVLAGWIAGILFFSLARLFSFFSKSSPNSDWAYELEGLLIIACYMAFIIFAVWLILVVPFCIAVPQNSRFWNPWITALTGGLVGPVLIMILGCVEALQNSLPISERMAPNLAGILFFATPTVIVGVVTGLVGAHINKSWDRQFEADVRSGKLDSLGREADNDYDAGRCKPL